MQDKNHVKPEKAPKWLVKKELGLTQSLKEETHGDHIFVPLFRKRVIGTKDDWILAFYEADKINVSENKNIGLFIFLMRKSFAIRQLVYIPAGDIYLVVKSVVISIEDGRNNILKLELDIKGESKKRISRAII